MKDDVIRVLLVDGAPEVCQRLALLVKNEKMNPLLAYNAKTALDRIRLTSPDLSTGAPSEPGLQNEF